MQSETQNRCDPPREGETLLEFEYRFLQHLLDTKTDEQRAEEQLIRSQVFSESEYRGAIRRAIIKRVAVENIDFEYVINEQIPYTHIFGESLDATVDEKLRLLSDDKPDVIEAAQVAIKSLANAYLYNASVDVQQAMNTCQSPIEAVMLSALIVVCKKHNWTVVLKCGHRFPYGMTHRSHNSPVSVSIDQQVEVGSYRVDFMLDYQYVSTEYPPEALENVSPLANLVVKPELVKHQKHRARLIVECDGHDFHEKTRQQVARDKRRDRFLQGEGYKVFRFSGHEINDDAIACALEVLDGFNISTGSKEEVSAPQKRT